MQQQPGNNPIKQPLWRSYLTGITDSNNGEDYRTIFRYFWPELVTAFLLCSVLNVIDAAFIGHLKSTSMYATQGVTSTFIYLLTKIAEGFSIGTVVACGQHNGQLRHKDVGVVAITSLWMTLVVGAVISGCMFFFPHAIYSFYQVPERMMQMGIPFLRLRAVGIFFSFLYFALIGFLRGIKRPELSMKLFLIGGVVFVFFDYALIFGHFGFPALGLQGSAWASVIQYGVMLIAAVIYIVFDKDIHAYGLSLFRGFNRSTAREILHLSWPVMLDKATVAGANLWKVRLLAPLGKVALASFSVIKDMEQFAFVPVIAFAQVITFLVSNDYGAGNWKGIKNNIKKTLFVSSLMAFSILFLFSLYPVAIIQLFDKKGTFTAFAAQAFPLLSLFVCFDVLQCLLAGAMRGTGSVKTVMWTRLICVVGIFGPLSYLFSSLSGVDPVYKFVLILAAYYLSNGCMSFVYVYRFRRDAWKNNIQVKPSVKIKEPEHIIIEDKEREQRL
jgi:putative MATE family efflux protein